MSVSAPRYSPTVGNLRSSVPVQSTLREAPNRWRFLIPVITALAIGAFYLPNTGFGMVIGVVTYLVTHTIRRYFYPDLLVQNPSQPAAGREKQIKIDTAPNLTRQLAVTLVAPCLEELVYRGAFQPLLTHVIVWLWPMSVQPLTDWITTATAVSALVTGVIFGWHHFSCGGPPIQGVLAAIGGVALGLLAATIGLEAAVAAHMVHNLIVQVRIERTHTTLEEAQKNRV